MDRSRIGVEPDRADRRGPVDRPSNVTPHRFFAAGLGFRARRTRSHSHRRAVPRIELPAPLTRWRPLALVWCRRRASRPVRSTVSARASRCVPRPVPAPRRSGRASRRGVLAESFFRATSTWAGAGRARGSEARPARGRARRGASESAGAPTRPSRRRRSGAESRRPPARAPPGPFSAHLASPRPRSKLTLLSTPLSRIRFARRSARRSRSRRTRCVPPRPRSFPRARADSRGRPNAPPTVSPRPRPSRAGTAASAFRTGDDAESSDAPHRPRASNFYAVETFAARTRTTTR